MATHWQMSFPLTYDSATLHKPYVWNLLKSLCLLYKQRLSFYNNLEIKHSTNPLTFLADTQHFLRFFVCLFVLPVTNLLGKILPELHCNLLNDEEVSMHVWYLRKLCDILGTRWWLPSSAVENLGWKQGYLARVWATNNQWSPSTVSSFSLLSSGNLLLRRQDPIQSYKLRMMTYLWLFLHSLGEHPRMLLQKLVYPSRAKHLNFQVHL